MVKHLGAYVGAVLVVGGAVALATAATPSQPGGGEQEIDVDFARSRVAAAPYGTDDAITLAASLVDRNDDNRCVYLQFRVVAAGHTTPFELLQEACEVDTLNPVSRVVNFPRFGHPQYVQFRVCRDDPGAAADVCSAIRTVDVRLPSAGEE